MTKLLASDALRSSVERHPRKIALKFGDKKLTYTELDERVNRLANGLLARGYKPGEHIAILAFNCIEYFEILFAIAKAGMVAIPLNFRLAGPEISYIVNQSECRALIWQAYFRETIEKVKISFDKIGKKDLVVFGGESDNCGIHYEELIAKSSDEDPAIEVEENQTWYIGYTSGTTGKPKGAMRSHRSNILFATSLTYLTNMRHTMLLTMPIFHSNSIWFGLAGIYYGHTVCIYHSHGFNPEEVLRIIQGDKITFTSMVPTMYSLILGMRDKRKYDASSLKVILCSSAPLMTSTKERILAFFSSAKLYEGYGSTETGAVTTLDPEDQYRKVRSCGVAMAYVRIKLLDTYGKEVPVGEVGELYTITPSMFEGYYKLPEADANISCGEYRSVGDMARKDAEGFYYIVDRKNDMIISGGENIYPSEIDDLLTKHPKIESAAVIGVPDEKWGEAVKAVVVPKSGVQITEEEIIAYVKSHLASYKCPKTVEFWASLPVSSTGKILKRQVRERFWVETDINI